jgi:hypothetical protein
VALLKRSQPLLLCGLLAVLPLVAQAEASVPEDEIKAAFLFHFAKFVEWPGNTDPALVMGVLGRDGFVAPLEQTVRNKTVNGKPLVIKRLTAPQESRGCHVVFIGGNDKNRVKQLVDALPPDGVLTVGEADQFAERGGMIGFVREVNRIRFEINVEAASRAGLHISSRLLQLARVVHTNTVTP